MATSAVTPDNDAVVAEVFIAAPPERVFQAITDPKQMPLWWGQQGLYRVTEWKADLRPGGKWQTDASERMAQTSGWKVSIWRLTLPSSTGSHLDRKLCGDDENRSALGTGTPARFMACSPKGRTRSGTGTFVKIRHEGFAGNLAQAKSHGDGWIRVLGWMQAFVEEGKTIDMREAKEVS